MIGAGSATNVRVISVPKVLNVGRRNLGQVASILRRADFPLGRVLVLSGNGPTLALSETVTAGLSEAGAQTRHCFAGLPARQTVNQLAREAEMFAADLIVGVGGGRVLDVAKSVAQACGIDFVSVPTSISHDGISSPVSSLVDAGGIRGSVSATTPAAVIIDIDVIEGAPLTTLRSGVGDLLSNLSAIEDWQLADARGKEDYDAYSALIADGAARPLLSLEGLARRGAAETLARGLILSGLAMATAGTSRPCSGAEHLISHALDHLLGPDARSHGAQVALGTLIATTARGFSPPGLHAAYYRFGLPLRPADLGLSMQLMTDAVLLARQTRPNRYTILDEMDLDKSTAADLVRRAFPS
ncbi:MAG: iron-containing alcohol dehydrogenase family protein [Mycobacteriales bacterium]